MLVGVQTDATTLENSLVVSLKTKHTLTIQHNNGTSGHLSQRNGKHVHTKHVYVNVRNSFLVYLPTPVLLPRKSHGWRRLVGCGPWGREESDTTERLHFHFSLSCIGEGNGNPLQCSCLENPRDGGAWWAAFYGVAQSRTRLRQLSSSSSSKLKGKVC